MQGVIVHLILSVCLVKERNIRSYHPFQQVHGIILHVLGRIGVELEARHLIDGILPIIEKVHFLVSPLLS